ncbi:hypothetical protein BASA50_008534 [Batrachochytrium salamandrivorans]|uniref:Extracellular metalloproteinase n=1 Tax=Batrachochytrium salamandrivorans TaxID=1357716 RepID=A0ABQ8F736_9FUNG|nr:hypothetical protein BASA50_008534 [Batrachochytrium salamandrivorans]
MFGPALTLVLALASSTVIAVPTVDNSHKHAVASLNPASTVLPFHFPKSVCENIPHSDTASSSFSKKDDVKTATDFISKKLNLGASDFKVFDSFTDYAGVTHVYGAHMANGARIANHQAAAHVKNGQVTSFSSSFGTAQHLAKRDITVSAPKATLDFAKASATASAQLGIPVDSESEHALEYVEQPDGKIVYAYKFQLRNNPMTKWVQVWCDATTGKVIQAVDFVNKASYKAIPIPRRDVTEGFSTVSNPEFRGSSPNGWTAGKATEGNNAITIAPNARTTPATSDGVFDTQFDSRGAPGTDANIAAAALFLTPPDGRPRVMNMYRYTNATPNRSPGFDNGVLIHEYGHGISNRLTGGPATSGCLSTVEAGGMGEGWSDMMALIVLAKSSDTATTQIFMGAYIKNRPAGIRSHPYTTDMRVNPLTYVDLRTRSRVHAIGEVWASLLWEIYWSLVAKHGFSANLHDASQSAGNIVTMRIIIGGMMLQPCNPTFIEARNAIIAADASYYNGANKCEIIKAFAKRGLGSQATNIYTNDFSITSGC